MAVVESSNQPSSFAAKSSVVDVFCGAGGLSSGFLQEGFTIKAGIDIDKLSFINFGEYS